MKKQLYNKNFPTPAHLAMDSCAIDISDQSIKYGELLATGEGLRLGHFGKIEIPRGVVVSGKIENQEKLVEILKKLREKENLYFVRVSLPEEQMYLFTLFLPKVNHNELRDIILLQIEEHIPLKAIDTIFEYDIISTSNDKILVEVSAISKITTDEYLSVFKKAGLFPLSFELEAQAIARAVVPHDDNSPVMIVDFGDTRTGVSIVSNNRVFFTTTLDIGGINLTNMIEKNFSLSFEKAEKMKRSYGLDGISNIDDIFPVILNGISVLRDELNKQYTYWKNYETGGVKNVDISRIILCGGDSNLNGLADYLEASMKIKVEHANAWVNISDMDISVPDMSFEESLSYATVLGLALGGFSQSSVPIVNVLPQQEKIFLYKEYWKRLISTLLIFFSLVTLISILLLLPSYFLSISKNEIVEKRLEELNINNEDVASKKIETDINKINTILGLLTQANPEYSISKNVLSEILSEKQIGITFSQILINSTKDKKLTLEIHGKAIDRTTLRNFQTSIENNENIASAEIPISAFLEKKSLNFTILITMK